MTKEEYLTIMNKPLSEPEKQILIDNGWTFANDTYIFIKDDYDGCMADGTSAIRKILMKYQYPELYKKHKGNYADILSNIHNII